MNLINRARRAQGLTLEQVAKKMNMSRGAYVKLEYGTNKLTLSRFIQICNVLDLDITTAIKEVQANESY